MAGTHTHPLFARVYPRIAKTAEAHGAAEHRRKLLAGLQGRVIEIGSGHGPNFPHYPASVTRLVAVECEPHMIELARRAADHAPIAVTVMESTAEQLPAVEGEFDAAVVSLVLCSVADQEVALREIARVLRPGGELRFYEHVVSRRPAMAAVQRVSDATVWPLLAGGCHCARDTSRAIRNAGFEMEREERIAFKPSPVMPAIPHILGIARRA